MTGVSWSSSRVRCSRKGGLSNFRSSASLALSHISNIVFCAFTRDFAMTASHISSNCCPCLPKLSVSMSWKEDFRLLSSLSPSVDIDRVSESVSLLESREMFSSTTTTASLRGTRDMGSEVIEGGIGTGGGGGGEGGTLPDEFMFA